MHNNKKLHNLRRGALATAVLAAVWNLPVHAFEVETGNPDFAIRFDNTVRLNYAQRVEAANSKIANSWNVNDGDRNFSSGSPVSQRADLLTELDVVYQGNKGFRVSAASWYDNAYESVGNDNPATNQIGNNGRPDSGTLSGFADRYNNGPSGEILDAFVFAGTELDNGMVLNGKAGKTTNYWGETLYNVAHGNSFGQGGLDLAKGLAIPGTEAKELFIPRKQLYGTLLINEEVIVGAQYFMGWQGSRLPESGSYLGFNDVVQYGNGLGAIIAQSPFVPFGGNPYLWLGNGKTYEPSSSGDYGLMAKWSPAWLDGTLSAFYRETSDLLPFVAATINPALAGPGQTGRTTGQLGIYNQFYADEIKLYGLSLSKNIGGVSIGWDLNYRENMPLQSVLATVSPAAAAAGKFGYISALPMGEGDIPGARGDTIHSVLNGLVTFADSPVWDAASLGVELSYDHVVSVDKENENLYKGDSRYLGIDKVTPNYWGFQTTFTPTWYQVLPSVDLSMPLTISQGISGHSAVASGGDVGTGTYSVGFAADFYNQYRFDLKYVDFFGKSDTCDSKFDGATPGAAGTYNCGSNAVTGAPNQGLGQITSNAGPNALLKDRGMITATFKTTF
jgi:hypothetical protein